MNIRFKSIVVLSSDSSSEDYGNKRYVTSRKNYDTNSVYNHLLQFPDEGPFSAGKRIRNAFIAFVVINVLLLLATGTTNLTIKMVYGGPWAWVIVGSVCLLVFLSADPRSEIILEEMRRLAGQDRALNGDLRTAIECVTDDKWGSFVSTLKQSNPSSIFEGYVEPVHPAVRFHAEQRWNERTGGGTKSQQHIRIIDGASVRS